MSVSRQSLGLSLGHRRLRFSFQINDFKDRTRNFPAHRLAPGVGGGGDVVASVFGVKAVPKNFLSSVSAVVARGPGAAGAASLERRHSRVNRIFGLSFASARRGRLGAKNTAGRQGASRSGRPTIQSKARYIIGSFSDFKGANPLFSSKRRPLRHRFPPVPERRRGYTQSPCSPQAESTGFADFLADSGSVTANFIRRIYMYANSRLPGSPWRSGA